MAREARAFLFLYSCVFPHPIWLFFYLFVCVIISMSLLISLLIHLSVCLSTNRPTVLSPNRSNHRIKRPDAVQGNKA